MVEYGQELVSLDPREPLQELVNRGAVPQILEQHVETGTRVPRNTQAPLTFSGSRSTAGQVFQVLMDSPAFLFSRRSYTRS